MRAETGAGAGAFMRRNSGSKALRASATEPFRVRETTTGNENRLLALSADELYYSLLLAMDRLAQIFCVQLDLSHTQVSAEGPPFTEPPNPSTWPRAAS